MKGTGVPLVTPFDEDGELDLDRLRRVAEWIVERGVDFVVPCGSTSEAILMTPEERNRVIKSVRESVDVPVIAGTGFAGTRQTVAATERAAAADVEGVLVVTPYYYGHSQAAIRAHYRTIADDVAVPVYLYSVPKFTGTTVTPTTVGKLADHPNITGIKDSSGDIEGLTRIRNSATEFDVFVGSGGVFAHGLMAGADGVILALANVAPNRVSTAVEAGLTENFTDAVSMNQDLITLNRLVTTRHGIPGLKAAMRERGIPAGFARQPFQSVDSDTHREIASEIEARL